MNGSAFEKIYRAHSHIDGVTVAQMITEFNGEFRDVYSRETMIALGAVGPLQSLIGLAVERGLLAVPGQAPAPPQKEDWVSLIKKAFMRGFFGRNS